MIWFGSYIVAVTSFLLYKLDKLLANKAMAGLETLHVNDTMTFEGRENPGKSSLARVLPQKQPEMKLRQFGKN